MVQRGDTSVLLVYWAISILPAHKLLFIVMALMPMSLFLMSSFNQDALLISLSLLFVACLLSALDKNMMTDKKRLFFLWLLIVFISLIKPLYSLLGVLLLFLPRQKFNSNSTFYFYVIFTFGSVILAVSLWQVSSQTAVVPFAPYVSPQEQIAWIVRHPVAFMTTIIRTILHYWYFYLRTHVGNLGWLDTPLPDYLILSYYLMIAFLAIYEKGLGLNGRTKAVMGAIFIGGYFFINLALYLFCSPVGAQYVYGLQGRYYLPLAPLFWLLFDNKNIYPKIKAEGSVASVIYLLLFAGLAITTRQLFLRYYS